MKQKKQAFSLIEIMSALLIVSIVLLIGFQSYSALGLGKINLITQTNIEKNNFYFSERLFELIKQGGSIDYEEYFNRKVVGTDITAGHYATPTGFGNYGYQDGSSYGGGFYYCRSGNGITQRILQYDSLNDFYFSEGCYNNTLNSNSTSPFGSSRNYTGSPQRYGQYSFQFIDYNSDYNDDLGDHDGDGNIIGDDDDENLGFGPSVFEFGTPLKELYLISGDKRRRTIFRWNIKQDENAPPSLSCEPDNGVFDACIGTIEFLRLTGEDWGMDHINNSKDGDGTEYDGVIDTWRIDTQFASGDSKKRAELDGAEGFRQALFPSTINITDFNIFVYPNKDYRNAWKEAESVTNLSPYIMLNYKMKPSWLARKQTKIEGKEVTINSTINLTDIFSK